MDGNDAEFPYGMNPQLFQTLYNFTDEEGKFGAIESCARTVGFPIHPTAFLLFDLVTMDEDSSFRMKEAPSSLTNTMRILTKEAFCGAIGQ